MDLDAALVECEQAQLAQNAVDVDGGQTQRVGEDELAEGAFELGLPSSAVHEEVSRAFDRAAAPNVD